MAGLSKYLLGDYIDTGDYVDRLSLGGLSEFPPLIVSCAITGANQGKESNPNLPEAPEEQAEQTYEAYQAGASIVHIHRRSSKNPAVMTTEVDEYREVNAMIRAKCPEIVIGDTASGGRIRTPGSDRVGELMTTSLGARPEVASFDITNFAVRARLKKRLPPLSGRDEDAIQELAYSLTPSEAEFILGLMKEHDIKPEFECFDIGDLQYLRSFIKAGLVEPPYLVQMVFHPAFNFPTIDYLMTAARCVPRDSIFSCIAAGATQFPLLAAAIAAGHHVRVGMEDNIYLARGRLARSNAELVERIVTIATSVGRRIATPAETREMLGLGAPRPFSY